MTDAFIPVALTVAPPPEPIAYADSEATTAILQGEGFRLLIQERLSQVTQHGYTPDRDLRYVGAELGLAAASYLDTANDLLLRPDVVRQPGETPDNWPWQGDFWKEPGPSDRLKALLKAGALLWAEIDREVAEQELAHSMRPVAPPAPAYADRWSTDPTTNSIRRRCGRCNHVDQIEMDDIRHLHRIDARTLPPCSNCKPEGGNHE